MITEITNGDWTHVIADETNSAWEYLQYVVGRESKKYADVTFGPGQKYTHCNVICWRGEPIEFFTMSAGDQFGERTLRGFTSQYTLAKYRDLKVPGSRFGAVEETVNFYDVIWPQVADKFGTHDLVFYTTLYGETNLESLFSHCLLHPEKWNWPKDKVYRIGRNAEKSSAWKFVNYTGDISLLNRPSMPTSEYLEQFAGRLPL